MAASLPPTVGSIGALSLLWRQSLFYLACSHSGISLDIGGWLPQQTLFLPWANPCVAYFVSEIATTV